MVIFCLSCHSWSSSTIHAAHGHHQSPLLMVIVHHSCCSWSSTTHSCLPLMVIHHLWLSATHRHLPTNTVVIQVIVCVCAHTCVSKLSNRKVRVKRAYHVTLGSFTRPPPSCLPATTVVIQ